MNDIYKNYIVKLSHRNETPMKKELRNTNDKKRKSLLSAYSSYTKISKYQIPSKYRGRKKWNKNDSLNQSTK